MYIQHKEYLALLDEIDYLKRDNTLLRDENALLAEQLIKQRQKRHQLEQYHVKNMKLIEELNAKLIDNQKNNKNQIIDKITQINQENKQFLEGKFTNLEKSALTKVQEIELKNAKTKVGFYQLSQFANKIRSMYKDTLGAQNFKGKKEPNLLQLLKWIKCLPGVAVNLSKTGFSSTMSSMSMSNIRKMNSSKLKTKDSHSTLNSTMTKSKVKL